VEEAKTRTVISSGNREIDDKMGGGVPFGSLTLIEGDSHSGKSVLSQQMMWGSLSEGVRLSFFTTENTVKSLVKQMQSLDIDVLDYLLLGKMRLYPMEIAQSKEDVFSLLLQAIRAEGQRGAEMIFVDALTPCITVAPADATLRFFEQCKRLCSDGGAGCPFPCRGPGFAGADHVVVRCPSAVTHGGSRRAFGQNDGSV